ncbi:hypothetical protein [Bacillus horti]|uniref:DUF3953 domain-containing protein n=1 Tax=Caldalkalibacillus horti TaxID=77523 RepID=A0ABT9VV07_9BACI|nr:hypothetical protein [Bacillus horti]MDQ0164460.1 hypothetical protein [Bacillus horti]
MKKAVSYPYYTALSLFFGFLFVLITDFILTRNMSNIVTFPLIIIGYLFLGETMQQVVLKRVSNKKGKLSLSMCMIFSIVMSSILAF